MESDSKLDFMTPSSSATMKPRMDVSRRKIIAFPTILKLMQLLLIILAVVLFHTAAVRAPDQHWHALIQGSFVGHILICLSVMMSFICDTESPARNFAWPLFSLFGLIMFLASGVILVKAYQYQEDEYFFEQEKYDGTACGATCVLIAFLMLIELVVFCLQRRKFVRTRRKATFWHDVETQVLQSKSQTTRSDPAVANQPSDREIDVELVVVQEIEENSGDVKRPRARSFDSIQRAEHSGKNQQSKTYSKSIQEIRQSSDNTQEADDGSAKKEELTEGPGDVKGASHDLAGAQGSEEEASTGGSKGFRISPGNTKMPNKDKDLQGEVPQVTATRSFSVESTCASRIMEEVMKYEVAETSEVSVKE